MTNYNESIIKTKDVIGVNVKNRANEDLGKIEEVMLDKVTGNVRYVVLSFGGFLGMGDKLFAIPWNALHYDVVDDAFTLDIDKERLKQAPGFQPGAWPNTADRSWGTDIFKFYGTKPYWDDKL